MEQLATSIPVRFRPSRRQASVDLQNLQTAVTEFLELYATPPMVPPDFQALLGEGDGETRFLRLLEASGYPWDPEGFFCHILRQLEAVSDEAPGELQVGGIPIPYHLGMSILEQVLPGDRMYDVKDVRTLERLTNTRVPAEDRETLQEVLDLYPVRFSSHVIRQMRLSPAIAYQYRPFTEELDPDGLVHTWVGQFHEGVVERMYRNRVIFLLNMACPVYCRFCFRKHKECRNEPAPTRKDVSRAVAYIRESPDIKEVVLTGGDPFMNRATLTQAIDGLRNVPHVETLRLATRSLAYFPQFFTKGDGFWVNYLRERQLELERKGKRLEVATHFLHPDEISRQSLDVISDLVGDGVPVYVQTPLLGGCNDSGESLAELFAQLRGAGAEMHYIFMPCSPLQGNGRYRTPISRGLETASHLRAHLSDRAIPSLCTATAIGKIDWGTSGWMVETDRNDESYLWIRTPYTREYFDAFTPNLDLSEVVRPNREGTLDARYLADPGDEKWIRGNREPGPYPVRKGQKPRLPEAEFLAALTELRTKADDPALAAAPAIVPSDSPVLRRVHETRVELDALGTENELRQALELIADTDAITDVVLHSRRDAARSLSSVSWIADRLVPIPHVSALRLRSQLFRKSPQTYADGVGKRLALLNRLRVGNPLRVEVESMFLHSSEFKALHGRVTRLLRQRGVTVYANIPLLGSINDSREEMLTLTSACRRLGIEVHHLVLAGMGIQAQWCEEHPVHLGDVIDLASHLREFGSGRELPAYILRTPLGEVDFGLSCDVLECLDSGDTVLRLFTYTLEDYRAMHPDFTPPSGATFGDDGYPTVRIRGLTM